MLKQTEKDRNSSRTRQAKTDRLRPCGVGLSVAACLWTLVGCTNSTLLDPPDFFTTTPESMLSENCGGKGEPQEVLLCADSNTSSGDPIALTYYLPADTATVRLLIYDTHGQTIRTLVNETEPRGWHTATWNLTDSSNRPVPEGNYRVFLKAGGSDVREGDVTIY
jgi:hypothetical protein